MVLFSHGISQDPLQGRSGAAAHQSRDCWTWILALHDCGVDGICGSAVNRDDVPDGGIHLSSTGSTLDSGIATVPQRGTLSERIPNSNHVVHVSVPCFTCALCSVLDYAPESHDQTSKTSAS